MSRQSRTSPFSGEILNLSGEWRADASEPDLAKTFADPEVRRRLVDVGLVATPLAFGAEFAESDGPLLYRRRLQPSTEPDDGRRRFLELDGIFYYGDVWFDGEYLGATEGYFTRHTFEVTDRCATSEHVLAIEVGARRNPTAPPSARSPAATGSRRCSTPR